MAFIKQKHKTDCGVAAIAMICDVTYEEADRVIPWKPSSTIHGLDTKQLRIAAERLGYESRGTAKQQLKRLENGSWKNIPDNSLVKVPNSNPKIRMWHWVVWRKGKVYDPARGVFNVEKIGLRPSAYMQFTKEDNYV